VHASKIDGRYWNLRNSGFGLAGLTWPPAGQREIVFWGLALQAFFGLLVLKMHPDAIFAASRPSPVS
jgi:hypothetical protein